MRVRDEEGGYTTWSRPCYANEGEHVTCENGHRIATCARDIEWGSMYDPAQFKDWTLDYDPVGLTTCTCSGCGAKWYDEDLGTHFEDGWR